MGVQQLPFIVLGLLLGLNVLVYSSFTEKGSCYRINYKESDSCSGKLVRSNVAKKSCCGGHYRRAWRPYSAEKLGPINRNQTFLENHFNTIAYQGFTATPQDSDTCQPCYTSCSDISCEEDQKCILKKGLPKCVCHPKCVLKNKSSICGSDGRTYASECHLLKRSCRKRQRLTIAHSGSCQTCRGVKCGPRKSCVLDEIIQPQCVRCPVKCDENNGHKSFCGTDGITYTSKCALKMASCKAKATIKQAYRGPCIRNQTCTSNSKLCRKGKTCLSDPITNYPVCTDCRNMNYCSPNERVLICASDGSSYQSRCAFRHASCRSKKALIVVELQFCNKKNIPKLSKPLKLITQKEAKCKQKKMKRQLKKITNGKNRITYQDIRKNGNYKGETLKITKERNSKRRKNRRKNKYDC